MGEVERSSAEGERLGVAAAGLQVCPRAPAAATRRLPPAPMRSISGSVRWDSGTTRSAGQVAAWEGAERLGCRWKESGGAVGRGASGGGMDARCSSLQSARALVKPR